MMARKRKSMSGAGKGMNAFFEDEPAEETQRQDVDTSTRQQDDEEPELKRSTFYLRPEQNIDIEELKLQLKKAGVKTNKSELVREALDLLTEQAQDDLEWLAHRLESK